MAEHWKIKSIRKTQQDYETNRAKENGLEFPEAGIPDLEAIAKHLGLTRELLQPEMYIKSKITGVNNTGKVKRHKMAD